MLQNISHDLKAQNILNMYWKVHRVDVTQVVNVKLNYDDFLEFQCIICFEFKFQQLKHYSPSLILPFFSIMIYVFF